MTSEDEWYKAAYYKNDGNAGNYWDYPTSSDTAPPGHDMTESTIRATTPTTTGYPYPIDGTYYTTVVGEFENSDSPYGTFDQGGNVWEWNESIPYSSSRGLRGGSFEDYAGHRCVRPTATASTRRASGDDVGFRVVSVPEPGSITLLVCGAIAGLICWRRRR